MVKLRKVNAEVGLLRARMKRLPSRERPRYRPWQRWAILAHRARYGLSLETTAKLFVVSVQTLGNWLREVESGVVRLVAKRRPLNALPDLVREVAHELRWQEVTWGTRRIAGVLAKLALKASRTSVQRILRQPKPRRAAAARAAEPGNGRAAIRPQGPRHVYVTDFTKVCAFMGCFKLTIGAVIDAFSRKVLAIMAWRREPRASDARELLRRAIETGGKPGHVITDHGAQFTAELFCRYLARRKIRHRYGAVGRPNSIALVERFWLTLKTEFVDAFFALKPIERVNRELRSYAAWFNNARPHGALRLRTPTDVFAGRRPCGKRRLKPGDRYAVSRTQVAGLRSLSKYSLRRVA